MASKSKQKGNTFEREVVTKAQQAGLDAVRAWGSNGRALGHDEEVDCLIQGLKVQCKRRASIAVYMTPSDKVDIQIVRGDRSPAYVVIEMTRFFELLKKSL